MTLLSVEPEYESFLSLTVNNQSTKGSMKLKLTIRNQQVKTSVTCRLNLVLSDFSAAKNRPAVLELDWN